MLGEAPHLGVPVGVFWDDTASEAVQVKPSLLGASKHCLTPHWIQRGRKSRNFPFASCPLQTYGKNIGGRVYKWAPSLSVCLDSIGHSFLKNSYKYKFCLDLIFLFGNSKFSWLGEKTKESGSFKVSKLRRNSKSIVLQKSSLYQILTVW